jgi:hypothetical protein
MLIVETGVGIQYANSYVSVDEADAYFTLMGNLDWDADDADKEQSLILATQSIDLLYAEKFLSWKKIDSKSPLLFPRLWFYDNNYQIVTQDQIPDALKRATFEVALMSLMGADILPQVNTDGNVASSAIKVGDLEITNQWRGKRGEVESYAGFRKIDLLLQPLLKRKQTKVTLIR